MRAFVHFLKGGVVKAASLFWCEQQPYFLFLLFAGAAAGFLLLSDRPRPFEQMNNPRQQNGNLRRKNRARFKAMNAPCGICKGKLGEIRYDEPSDSEHPLSFVIDEIRPIAKWKQYGYNSPREAAEDWNNLQAAHYICNLRKGAHTPDEANRQKINARLFVKDGDW